MTKKKQLLVFVVRHGEREDEHARATTPSSCYRKMSKRDKMDPNLTPEGYGQALQAFENIVAAMMGAAQTQKRRVAVFTSPLRRSIGTAMMLSAAAATMSQSNSDSATTSSSYAGLKFVLPTSAVETKESNNDGSDDADCSSNDSHNNNNNCRIPIVVHNGLSHCTALVARMGGSRNLIRAGMMPCAAMPCNTIDHPENHILQESLGEIAAVAKSNEKIHQLGVNCASTQFWRVEEGMEVGSSPTVPTAQSRHASMSKVKSPLIKWCNWLWKRTVTPVLSLRIVKRFGTCSIAVVTMSTRTLAFRTAASVSMRPCWMTGGRARMARSTSLHHQYSGFFMTCFDPGKCRRRWYRIFFFRRGNKGMSGRSQYRTQSSNELRSFFVKLWW